jgi:DNA-binding NarL/FixJ family response regulator
VRSACPGRSIETWVSCPIYRPAFGRILASVSAQEPAQDPAQAPDGVAAGLAALAAGRWAHARAAFEAALARVETPQAADPEVLDGLGEALWWLGEPQAALGYRQRAFVGFRQAGQPERAVSTALAVCVSYWINFGNNAAGSGWLARAESVLPDCEPGPARGQVWLIQAFAAADFDDACALIHDALKLARDTGDVDLELSALSDLGGRLVADGQIEDGLAFIDQALAAALAGECHRLETVVWASCTMMGACETAGDLQRATDWLRVIEDFTERYGCPFMYVTCRTHYAGLLLARGQWEQAERELATAVRMCAGAGPIPRAMAIALLADLRLRQGRLEEAETFLAESDHDLIAARLRLARGEPEIAAAILERHLRAAGTAAETASTLAMLAQAHLDAGSLDAAQACVDQLAGFSATQPGHYVHGLSATACGHLAAATGDSQAAMQHYHDALRVLTRLDLPFEAGQVRLALARACADTQPQAALAEARAALATFDRLQASAHADAAAAFLRSLGAPGRRAPRTATALTRREQEVLALLGHGLTNPEIAQRLFISRKTAAHHVSNLLTKLGLRNRAEAVAHATRPRTPQP